jgi:lipopolysaccharide export system protein LptA
MKGPGMAFVVVLATAAAHAQGIDLSKGGPINVTAQSGIEWLQNQHEVIATGDARAVRSNVTVVADRLIAFYRPKNGAAQQTSAPQPIATTDEDTGGNEIYRLEAESNVKIFTPTDMAQADKAVYDLDQAVLVLTGNNLRLTTPNDVLTARDDLEYWSLRHMAVARGDAVIITKDNRRIQADILVAYTTPTASTNQPQATKTSTNSNDDLASQSGKLEKAEAFGHVLLRTQTDIVTGDRGVYVPETGMAVLLGNVRITRGQNQLAGAEAIVNMKTGVSRLVSGNAGRVSGLIVPNDTTNNAIATQPATSHPANRKTHQ